MAFYVSVIDGPKVALALGPFNDHADALELVDPVRRYCVATWSAAGWWSFGTVRHKTARPLGKLNEAFIDVEVDA